MIDLSFPNRSPPTSARQRDGETVARCFTKQAVVKDEDRSTPSTASRREDRDVRQVSYTSEPYAVEQKDGRTSSRAG